MQIPSIFHHLELNYFLKSPFHPLPKLWNKLDDIKHQHRKTAFEIGLKEKLLDEIL
jgi:hypothetical protein